MWCGWKVRIKLAGRPCVGKLLYSLQEEEILFSFLQRKGAKDWFLSNDFIRPSINQSYVILFTYFSLHSVNSNNVHAEMLLGLYPQLLVMGFSQCIFTSLHIQAPLACWAPECTHTHTHTDCTEPAMIIIPDMTENMIKYEMRYLIIRVMNFETCRKVFLFIYYTTLLFSPSWALQVVWLKLWGGLVNFESLNSENVPGLPCLSGTGSRKCQCCHFSQ